MSLGRGFAFGFGLWIVMQMAFVPLGYGWLEFGLGGGHPWPAVVSLVLHLCYGGTLGWLGGRDDHDASHAVRRGRPPACSLKGWRTRPKRAIASCVASWRR